ncbi:hypothetical protein [Variovorax sp. DAIF25]|uniref:hypothetical protein n=1 Tax=Variovorax sp. DAIF25 TaxID=3080983 RepID=UPI003D6A1439
MPEIWSFFSFSEQVAIVICLAVIVIGAISPAFAALVDDSPFDEEALHQAPDPDKSGFVRMHPSIPAAAPMVRGALSNPLED